MDKDLMRFNVSFEPVGEIDRENGIIYGVSLITGGREASGHGVYIDETMVDQVVEMAQAKEPIGLKCRFDHPGACSRSMGTFTGRFHNTRRDGAKARADLHLAAAAEKSPDGDLRTYILDLAAEDPEAFATSIVFRPDESFVPDSADKGEPGQPPEDDPFWMPHARIAALHQCDVVDEGAANEGLFGRPDYMAEQTERWSIENMPVVDRIMSAYSAWKAKKQESKMSDEMKEQVEILTSERDELSAKVVELEAAVAGCDDAKKVEFDAGVEQGKEDICTRFKSRLEKFGEIDFVGKTLELGDTEALEAYVAHIKANPPKVDDDDDPAPLEMAPAGELNTGDTYESKKAEFKATGMSEKQAIRKIANEHTELHQQYIEDQNKKDKE